jgi:hypothetical protein
MNDTLADEAIISAMLAAVRGPCLSTAAQDVSNDRS